MRPKDGRVRTEEKVQTFFFSSLSGLSRVCCRSAGVTAGIDSLSGGLADILSASKHLL